MDHSAANGSWHPVLHSLGAGSLGQYIDFVQRHADPAEAGTDAPSLLEAWRAAQAHRAALAQREPRAAEAIAIHSMPAALNAHLSEFLARKATRSTYDTVPVTPALVEIDRLAVYQSEIDLDKADALAARVGSKPDPVHCFELAFGRADLSNGDDWLLARHSDDSWEFSSAQHDFRYLGAHRVAAQYLPELAAAAGAPGAVAAVALLVGFSANHVSAVRFRERVVLHNGYHRVFALRRLGITHVPCMIEVPSTLEEAALAGAGELAEHAEDLFDAPRPPLFGDFFDPALTRTFRARRLRRHVRLSVDSDSVRLAQP